jgi:molybdate transport system permease protein
MATEASHEAPSGTFQPSSDVPFYASFGVLGGVYVVLIVAMLMALFTHTSPMDVVRLIQKPEIWYSIKLSMLSCTITSILALWVAVPIGYLMSRRKARGKSIIDAILDVPIVLPPLVVGLCLLILFSSPLAGWIDGSLQRLEVHFASAIAALSGGRLDWTPSLRLPVTYEVPAVILAQFMVAAAFAVRTMRVTFDQIHPRCEQVALTLGCSAGQAFWLVAFPQARHGLVAAGTLAWARSLGEFGPILIFAGATRFKTEVLPTSVYLEFTVGNIEGAVGASLIMVVVAMMVLVFARVFGLGRMAI